MDAVDERVSPISRGGREAKYEWTNECMKFSTDFRRLIWIFIRTAEREEYERGGREGGRPAESTERRDKDFGPCGGCECETKEEGAAPPRTNNYSTPFSGVI